MIAKHPERVVSRAVQGMLPQTKLGRAMIKKLKVYAGAEHPHAGAACRAAWTPGRKGTRNG